MAQLITSIIGGFQGSSAAKDASEAQQKAIAEAIAAIQGGVNQANPLIETAQENVRTDVTGAGSDAALAAEEAARAATGRVDTGTTTANELLAPYLQGGAQAFTNLSSLVTQPQEKFQFTQDDPSYQFRLNEGIKALQRTRAVGGPLQGRGVPEALTRYSQDYASTEYQKAFDRFRQTQNDRFAQLSGVAGIGYDAAGTAGRNITTGAQVGGEFGTRGATTAGGFRTDAAQFAGDVVTRGAGARAGNIMGAAGTIADLTTDRGNAIAAGHLGAANAWNGALSTIGGGVDSMLAGGFGGPRWSWRRAIRGY